MSYKRFMQAPDAISFRINNIVNQNINPSMQEDRFKAFDYDEIVGLPYELSDVQPLSQIGQTNTIKSYSGGQDEDDSSNLMQEKSESIQQRGAELIKPSFNVLLQALSQQDRLHSRVAALPESGDSNEKVSKSAESTKSKNDQRRNLYPNVIKSALKRILKSSKQTSFYRKLARICRRVDGTSVEVQKFQQFCKPLTKYVFSLKTIYYYMNFEEGEPQERLMKKVFHQFMLWYLEKRYTIDLIQSKQCECKEEYFRGKNALRYLPSVITKKRKRGQQKYAFIKQ